MEFLQDTVNLCSWVGLVPVKKTTNKKKGPHYRISKKVFFLFLLQIVSIPWMVMQFSHYMTYKYYYHSQRKLQITALMFSEVIQSFITVFCSIFFRFPNVIGFLEKCTVVCRELGKTNVPFLIRYSGVIVLFTHTVLTIYRIKDSPRRLVLLIPFWIGMAQVWMLHVFIYAILIIVDLAYYKITEDISLIMNRRNDNSFFIEEQLRVIRDKHTKVFELISEIRSGFGPDLFFICLIFLLKLSFIGFHLYFKRNMQLWGQNSLVGEITGYFQIIQILVSLFCIAYVCDCIFEKKCQVHIQLLTLLKDRNEDKDEVLRNIVKTFLLQVKSQPNSLSVCRHFTLNRALIYNMILASVTYLFFLIQFQRFKA